MKSFRVLIERELRGRGFDYFSGREPLGKLLGRIIENHIAHNVLKTTRGSVFPNLLPQRDSDCELEYAYYFSGQWRRLDIATNGSEITAVDQDGLEYFDLLGKRRSRDGKIWEEWDWAAESLATRKTT